MARANHARCLHCGVRLPLYRQLTEAGFCSTQHRKAFQDDQARLAVARLIENQQMLSRVSDEARDRDDSVEPEPLPSEPLALDATEDSTAPNRPVVPDFVSFESADTPDVPELVDWPSDPPPEKPVTLHPVEEVPAVCVKPDPPQTGLFALCPHRVRMSTPNLVAADPIAFDFCGELSLPPDPASGPRQAYLSAAAKVEIVVGISNIQRTPSNDAAAPVADPETSALAFKWPASTERLPFLSGLRASAGLRNPGRIDALDNTVEPLTISHAVPPRSATWLPLPGMDHAAEPVPVFAGMHALPEQIAQSGASCSLAMREVEPRHPGSPDFPRLDGANTASVFFPAHDRLAENSAALLKPHAAGGDAGYLLPEASGPAPIKGRELLPKLSRAVARTALRLRSTVALRPASAVEPPLTFGIKGGDWTCVDRRNTHSCPDLPPSVLRPDLPVAGKVAIPLGVGANIPHTRGLMLRALRDHEPYPATHRYPKQKFELQRLAGDEFLTLAARVRPAAVAASARSTARYLKAASRGIQLMAIAVPVLLFIAFRPAPKPEATSAAPSPLGRFVNSRITDVKSALQSRAGLEYLDDFRAGLDNWEGQSDLTRSWSYDQTGFVRPGPLALYRPSRGMSDYQFEFLGQIDKRAIGWVFRAQDLNNYYVAKLVMLKSGPLPTVGLERYPVIRGKAGRHVQVTLPLNVHQDTVYRVRMELRGADYALYVQDQLVHFWSDPRLPAGGVGFFSGQGEQSRIRWMQVSHQYDAIGRLCAYFAPMAIATYNLDSSMGAGSK